MARRVFPRGGRKKARGRKDRRARRPREPGLCDKGLKMLFGGDARGAAELFASMIRDRPQDPGGHAGMGAAFSTAGRPKEALEHFKKALNLGDERADTRLNMGSAYNDLDMYDEAVTCYRAALEKAPDVAAIHFSLADVRLHQGMYEDALKSADEALRLDPRFYEAAAVKGEALIALERHREAAAFLGEAARAHPGSRSVQAALGSALLAGGDAEAALARFDAAIGAGRPGPELHRQRGEALAKLGRPGPAYEAYADAVELAPDARTYAAMVELLIGMHEGEAAGDWHAEALSLADKAIGKDPDYAPAHAAKARLLELSGADPGAHRDAAARLEKKPDAGDPSDPLQVRLSRGMHMLMEEENTEGALSHFRALVRDAPGFGEGHEGLGMALGISGDAEGALAELKEAHRLGVDDAGLHSNMGNAYHLLCMAQKAEKCYLKSASIDPEHALAHANLARIYQEGGRSEEAVERADRALRLEPGNPEANMAKGVALADMGRFPESLKPLEEAVRATPESCEARVYLGQSLSAVKDTGGALRCFEAAVRLDPENPAAHHERGNMLARQQRFQEAYDSYAKSAELEPRAQTYANMATALSNMHVLDGSAVPEVSAVGQEWHDRAMSLADKALKMDPGYAYAHFTKARLLEMAQLYAEAERHFERAGQLDHDFIGSEDGSHVSSDNVERRRAAREMHMEGRRRRAGRK